MKNFLIYLFVGSMCLSACSNFLDSEPIWPSDENFYRTRQDAEMALVGCYDGLQLIYNAGVGTPLVTEILSDNAFGGTGNGDNYEYQMLDEFDLQRSPGHLNTFDENWKAYYKAIYRVNTLLTKMDQIDWGTEEDAELARLSIEAQARFIRAYCYFDMVRLWERVPLLLEPQNGNIPQSSYQEIYTAVVEDLMFTAANGMEEISAGRANKWVAKSFLARVYLYYTGYYGEDILNGKVSQQEVLNGLEEVISSGNYNLLADFKDLWIVAATEVSGEGDNAKLETTYAGKDNEETIFAIKYNVTSDWEGNTDGNHWLVMLGMRGQNFSPYGSGWGAMTVNPQLYNLYSNEDSRKSASIIAFKEEGLEYNTDDQREYTGYANKKYLPMCNPDGSDVINDHGGSDFMIHQFQDYVAMRYSDVLLMAAELGSTNAQTYMDQVRGRAGVAAVGVSPESIQRERRLEFAFEGIRYWDLLRQGVETAATAIDQELTVISGGNEETKKIKAENILSKRGLQMIPQNQITRSAGVMTQNPGWN
ncbi:RagB/SusD family nutrient uptake outer membrane protein [Persicobacter diffluens]|uniref:Membrane protein n=1 Tax=Persicobacter diffluens TaxID=981 RepID=A0AAN4W1X2_9BACT|nr:membrane protein [Persicobacter diffluens]